MSATPVDRFATYIAALGRGPGRSRPLTRGEAADAMAMLLDGTADPIQVGAFLMLLRYRGEAADEIVGLVETVQARTRQTSLGVALDWPSYGAGRSRGAPWFLLAAMALGQSGFSVLMHGTNAFSAGMSVTAALALFGLAPVGDAPGAARQLALRGFAYWPIEALCPPFAALLGLRRLLGLRSPLNTVARLLDPAGAAGGVDGVFHPPYIETHLAAAEALGRPRLLVLKGGGGEVERNPAKAVEVRIWDAGDGRSAQILAPLETPAAVAGDAGMVAVWNGQIRAPAIEARIIATIAIGLIALRRGGDREAQILWESRRPIV